MYIQDKGINNLGRKWTYCPANWTGSVILCRYIEFKGEVILVALAMGTRPQQMAAAHKSRWEEEITNIKNTTACQITPINSTACLFEFLLKWYRIIQTGRPGPFEMPKRTKFTLNSPGWFFVQWYDHPMERGTLVTIRLSVNV